MSDGRVEVLAPAGGREQLVAAVRCGADAVYMGAKGFNARRNAENFDALGLAEAVSYCHARGVRVHVTINTLVTDQEFPALLDTLGEVCASGADAAIVQDLAVARLIRERCPDLALHASTQMTIHNPDGAKLMRELGFSRVVLARELTLAEIRRIADESDIELEAFVHGALCVSASGACYLSSILGGRSGNRGLCAQPCRLDFRAGGRPFALSLKDMSYLERVAELREAGVVSLKIEGRMKRPEYVAAAVTAARRAVDGETFDARLLRDAFSRGGFTDGYLSGRRTLDMFGTRGKDDVEASARAQRELPALYRRERQSVPVDMELRLIAGAPAALSASDGENAVSVSGAEALKAISRPTDESAARRQLEKTGDTPFAPRGIKVINGDGLALPASELNALRRDALAALLAARERVSPLPLDSAPVVLPAPHTPAPRARLRLRFESASQLPDDIAADEVALPLGEITREHVARFGDALIAELPQMEFGKASLIEARALGVRRALAENLYAVRAAREANMAVSGGHGLNVLNSLALDELARLGLADATVSFELHMARAAALGGALPRGIIAYGRLPLMQLRTCPFGDCASCDGRPELTDRTGARFPLICHGRRYRTLLNSLPLWVEKGDIAPLDFVTLYFTVESAKECARVARDWAAGSAAPAAYTRGLYFRGLK